MKKLLLLLPLCCLLNLGAQAQQLRMFLDVPSVYLHSPQLDAIQNNAGLGMDVGFGLGTHYLMSRLSAGTMVTADFQSDEIEKSVLWLPFVRLEAGAGLWRSNGNKCSRHDSNAFTALAKGGMQYAFQAQEMQFTVGAELGYFRIRDYFRNVELFLDGGYNVTADALYGSFGMRYFLNLRA